MVIGRIFRNINNLKWFPVIFMSPLAYAIGNCAEEIYYALLKARREDKKVILLYSYNLPFWLVKYRLTNRELFKVDSEYIYFKKNSLLLHALRLFVTLVYLPLRVVSLWLRDSFGAELSVSYRFPRIGMSNIYQPNEKIEEFSWDAVHSLNWRGQFSDKLSVSLIKDSNKIGKNNLRELGLSDEDWFVCVHVRESGFKNDAGRHEYRNSSIINYTKAFERIIERGGWVIRMGDSTMTELPKMERVIDYPFTKFKSDLMDIFLIKNCRVYIGCQSGIHDVAILFQKPILITNMCCWNLDYPVFENSRGIVKHLSSHSKKRILTVKEMFEASWCTETLYGYVDNEKFKWYENSPEDIEEAVIEYMDLLESQNFKRSRLQNEAYDTHIKTYHEFCDKTKYTGLSFSEEMIEKWRFASRITGSNGAISQKFLEKYWN